MRRPLKSLPVLIAFSFYPFIVAASVTVGLIYYSNANKAVNSFAENFTNDVSSRVEDRLNSYLKTPKIINEMNFELIKERALDIRNSNALEIHFQSQMRAYRRLDIVDSKGEDINTTISGVYYSNGSNFHGSEYFEGEVLKTRSNETTNYLLKRIGEFNEHKSTIGEEDIYEPQTRPWYKTAKNSADGKQAWTEVYNDFTHDIPVITAVHPIGDNYLEGVLNVDLLVSEIRIFLDSLKVSENGIIFIINSKNQVITTSGIGRDEELYKIKDEKNSEIELFSIEDVDQKNVGQEDLSQEDLKKSAMTKALIKSTSDILLDKNSSSSKSRFGILETILGITRKECTQDNIQSSVLCQFVNEDRINYLKVISLDKENGLKWRVVIVIPESDFREQLRKANYQALWTSIAILLMAVPAVFFAAHKISSPIIKLTDATGRIKELINELINDKSTMLTEQSQRKRLLEDYKPLGEVSAPDEIKNLADTFDGMVEVLDKSFSQLETNNVDLRLTNKELEASKSKLQRTNETYDMFFPRQFLKLLGINDITEVDFNKRVQKRMTILFSDIRKFTTISEKMSEQDNFRFINDYFASMEPEVVSRRGLIDKYIGDEIMALFAGDENGNGSGKDAVDAALGMLRALSEFNNKPSNQKRTISIGIGIHTGGVKLGMVGGETRKDGTVISRNVNLASRLEGLTKHFGTLLISEPTLHDINELDRESYHYRYLGDVKPKGTNRLVKIYEIYDVDQEETIQLKTANKEIFQEAIELTWSGKYEKALPLFREIHRECPTDRAAQYYLDCCEKRKDPRDEFDEK